MMKQFDKMRSWDQRAPVIQLLIAIALCLSLSSPSSADFASGKAIFERALLDYVNDPGKVGEVYPSPRSKIVNHLDNGVMIWRRSAWVEDDPLSQYCMGNIYAYGFQAPPSNAYGSDSARQDAISAISELGDVCLSANYEAESSAIAVGYNPSTSLNGTRWFYDPIEGAVWHAMTALNVRERYADEFDTFQNLACRQLARILTRLSAEDRWQVEGRLIYILSTRGAEGYYSLGELYKDGGPECDGIDGLGNSWFNEIVDFSEDRKSLEDYSTDTFEETMDRMPSPEPPNMNEVPLSTEDDIPDAQSSWTCTLLGWWDEANCAVQATRPNSPINAFTDTDGTDDDFDDYDDDFDDDYSFNDGRTYVIQRNPFTAAIFFAKAVDVGHPLAQVELNRLRRESLGDNLLATARMRAQDWKPPFDTYPAGHESYPKRNREIWSTDWSYAETISYQRFANEKLVQAYNDNKITVKHIQQALYVLNFQSSKGGTNKAALQETEQAVKSYQISIGEFASGTLTDSQGFKLFQRAAESGDAPSQTMLAIMYNNGWGTPKNSPLAVRWFQAAAAQDYMDAHFYLHLMLKNQDSRAAYHCLEGRRLSKLKENAGKLKDFQDRHSLSNADLTCPF